MKTLIIHSNEFENCIEFAILDGDYSHLNNLSLEIDGEEPEKMYEFNDLNIQFKADLNLVSNKQWDKVIMIISIP